MSRILLFLPTLLFCSENTDIVPRTINFIIFFSLLLYFVFNHIKNFYNNRINSIAEKLERTQEKVLELKAEKEKASQKLSNAKQQANDMISNAHNQSGAISKAMEEDLQKEILAMQKMYKDKKSYVQQQAKKEVVSSVLDKLLNDEELELTQDDLLNIIRKKVA